LESSTTNVHLKISVRVVAPVAHEALGSVALSLSCRTSGIVELPSRAVGAERRTKRALPPSLRAIIARAAGEVNGSAAFRDASVLLSMAELYFHWQH
jgi:hypothetical protein